MIINNHFTPGNTEEAELSRINSTQIVIQKISELIDDDYLVVIIGDFNAKPNSGSINKFNENGFYGVDITNQPTYSGNFDDIRTLKLDYIFIKKNLKASEVRVNQFKDNEGFFPSDHLPIQATIRETQNWILQWKKIVKGLLKHKTLMVCWTLSRVCWISPISPTNVY